MGAHWQTPVKLALDWTGAAPATVTASSTLEDFEWQDRYPTAKIRETYNGPVNFPAGPGLGLPLIAATDVKYERVIYFAYNAGRVVRTETTMTLTTTVPGLLVAPTTPTGYPGGSPSYPGGAPGGSFGSSPTYPGGRTSPGGRPGYSSGMPGEGSTPGGTPYPGSPSGFPGGPSGFPSGISGAGAGAAPTKLTFTETSVILI